jgi:integrase
MIRIMTNDRPLIKREVNRVSPITSYLARMTPASRDTMRKSLKRIVVSVDESQDVETFPWHELRTEHVGWIRSQLQDRVSSGSLAPDSANLSLKALRGVMRESWRLGLISDEIFHRTVDFPPVRGSRLPRGRHLETREIREIVEVCSRDGILGLRDLALFAVLAGGGLRRSEACDLKIGDVKGNELRVIGKGGKERTTYLPGWAVSAMDRWLEARGRSPGYLICRIHRHYLEPVPYEGITPSHVLRLVEKRAGDETKPHDLRRTFVGLLLDAGVDISTVAQLAGHSQVQTTARYDRRGEERKREAVKKIDIY